MLEFRQVMALGIEFAVYTTSLNTTTRTYDNIVVLKRERRRKRGEFEYRAES